MDTVHRKSTDANSLKDLEGLLRNDDGIRHSQRLQSCVRASHKLLLLLRNYLRAYANAPTPISEACKLITCEFVDSAWADAFGCLVI